MKETFTADKRQTLPSKEVEVVQTTTKSLILISTRDRSTRTVALTESQAVKIQKLGSLSGDPLPTYRNKKEFALATDIPSTTEESPHPIIRAEENTVQFESAADSIYLEETDWKTLRKLLTEWGYTMDTNENHWILSFPAMIELGDGITEPLLHANHDEILEHYHQPIGYWSQNLSEYIVQH